MKDLIKNKKFQIFLIVLISVSFFTLIAFFTYGRSQIGIDDANITFVYARNFAQGYGFVYNIGGESVEGFSSMLWVLIIAVLYKFLVNPEILILGINVLILSASLSYFIHTLLRNFSKKGELFSAKQLIIFGVLLSWVLAVPNYIVWSTITLMEFGLYSSLLMIGVSIIIKASNGTLNLKESRLFFVLLPMLILIRPESMLWGILFIVLYISAKFFNTRKPKESLKAGIAPLGIYIATLAALIIFRLTYFGYPLPNTYYAKVSVNLMQNLKDGYYYILNFVNSNSIVLLFLLAVVIGLSIFAFKFVTYRKLKSKITLHEFQLFLVSIILAVGIFVPVFNGGDHFAQFRFIQPIWPILIIPIIFILQAVNFKNILFNRLYLVVSVVLVSFFIFYSSDFIKWHKFKEQKEFVILSQFNITISQRQDGEKLNRVFENFEIKPVIGVVAAGGFKMTYSGKVNDLLGLNNVQMAHASGIREGIKNHAAFNKDVFYQQTPDIINLLMVDNYSAESSERVKVEEDFMIKVFKEIYNEDKFKELYSRAVVYNNKTDYYIFGYFKRDFLSELKNRNSEFEVKEVSRSGS